MKKAELCNKEMDVVEVKEQYPIEGDVYLDPEWVRANCGLVQCDPYAIAEVKWRVLNYFYKVSSRKKEITHLVVGIHPEDWAKLGKSAKRMSSRYGSLDMRRMASVGEEGTNDDGVILYPTKLFNSIDKDDRYRKWCVLLVGHNVEDGDGRRYRAIIDKPILGKVNNLGAFAAGFTDD